MYSKFSSKANILLLKMLASKSPNLILAAQSVLTSKPVFSNSPTLKTTQCDVSSLSSKAFSETGASLPLKLNCLHLAALKVSPAMLVSQSQPQRAFGKKENAAPKRLYKISFRNRVLKSTMPQSPVPYAPKSARCDVVLRVYSRQIRTFSR